MVDNLRNIKYIGRKKYYAFVDRRILCQKDAFTTTLSQTKLKLFKASLVQPRQKTVFATMKDQQTKATQMLLASHSGRNISEKVMAHETPIYPSSLTRRGEMHHGSKSVIFWCIEPEDTDCPKSETTAAVLDDAVLMHMRRPGGSVTIADYIRLIFIPCVE